MGKINWGRVVLGGLLFGLVTYVLGAAGWLFYGEQWMAAMQALGRPFPTSRSIATFGVLPLVLGIVTIWLYAAIRPRYGPGPKTAALAGFALWLILSLADAFWASLHLLPIRLIAKGVGAYLVIIVVAAVVGAWPYRE